MFNGSYANDVELAGPLSPYAIGELIIQAGYTGTITLAFPLEVGDFQMAGGIIDQPSSAYGSDLTITGAASITDGVLNSTANESSVIFEDAVVSINATNGISSGSEFLFSGITEAILTGGTLTFTNDVTVFVNGTAAVSFPGITISAVSSANPITVDGGSLTTFGTTSLNSLYVLHGGTVTVGGNVNHTLTITGTIPGSSGSAVSVVGGDLNIRNGTTLDAGSNYIHLNGFDGSTDYTGRLNTYAALPADSTQTESPARIKTAKLFIGTGTGEVIVTVGADFLRPDIENHHFSKLEVEGPVEWHRGTYVPTVSATNAIRDVWSSTGIFSIRGTNTDVTPIDMNGDAIPVNNKYIVLEAGTRFEKLNNDNTFSDLPLMDGSSQKLWEWVAPTAYDGPKSWNIKRSV